MMSLSFYIKEWFIFKQFLSVNSVVANSDGLLWLQQNVWEKSTKHVYILYIAAVNIV